VKVLIIDDEEDIRSIARFSLSRVGGMEVEDASSGAEGLRKAETSEPDVVLLDVMMPVQDGPSVLTALRANPATARIPIVFLTAKAMSAEVARLLAMGARGVLTKPFDPMKLPGLLRELIPEA